MKTISVNTSSILPRFVELIKIAALFLVFHNLFFSKDVLRSVKNELTRTSLLEESTTQNPRYAIAMYVDMDEHIFGLYSILRQAQITGMVAEGVEVVVAVSEHLLQKQKRKIREEELAKIETKAQKQDRMKLEVEQMQGFQQKIMEKQNQITAEKNALEKEEDLETKKKAVERIESLVLEQEALVTSKQDTMIRIKALRKEVAITVDREAHNEEGSLAAEKLLQWHEEGLIHHIHPFNKRLIMDIVDGSGLWEGVFNKLFLFNLTQYDKLIRLDCDVLIRQNIRHWFDYETPCAIQAHDELEWNSGVMVISPSRTVFDALMTKLPSVQKLERKKTFDVDEPDTWNSGVGEQGFLSSYFTRSTDPALRMKTMPTEDAICISSLLLKNMQYFWYRRNHIFNTVHMTTEKPWNKGVAPDNPVQCEVLREWQKSVDGIERYNLTITNQYLKNCRNASTVPLDV